MRKIAIITLGDVGCYECDYSNIITSITEWSEVTDEDFEILKLASSKSYTYSSKLPKFTIIERPIDENLFICKTIDDYRAMIVTEENRKAEEKRKRAESAEKRKKASASKKIETLKKQLAKLESEK